LAATGILAADITEGNCDVLADVLVAAIGRTRRHFWPTSACGRYCCKSLFGVSNKNS